MQPAIQRCVVADLTRKPLALHGPELDALRRKVAELEHDVERRNASNSHDDASAFHGFGDRAAR